MIMHSSVLSRHNICSSFCLQYVRTLYYSITCSAISANQIVQLEKILEKSIHILAH